MKVFGNTVIYILAPAQTTSGGQEALHQLNYYFVKLGYKSKIAYYLWNRLDNPVAPSYRKYQPDYCSVEDIEDCEKNILISPESVTYLMSEFNKIRKCIWWLSVGFFKSSAKSHSMIKIISNILRLKFKKASKLYNERKKSYSFFTNDNITHFAASYYAFNFLKMKGIKKPQKLIEPLGLDFLNYIKSTSGNKLLVNMRNRKPNILYNPAKKSRIMKTLLKRYPEYNFVKLAGYTHNKLIKLMSESVLYVDFGNFPGPERLPKEAAVCGCCIITGTKGAAAFYEDVSIDSCYKIAKANQTVIINTIDRVLNNFNTEFQNFNDYREMIYSLEKNFQEQIKNGFTKE